MDALDAMLYTWGGVPLLPEDSHVLETLEDWGVACGEVRGIVLHPSSPLSFAGLAPPPSFSSVCVPPALLCVCLFRPHLVLSFGGGEGCIWSTS